MVTAGASTIGKMLTMYLFLPFIIFWSVGGMCGGKGVVFKHLPWYGCREKGMSFHCMGPGHSALSSSQVLCKYHTSEVVIICFMHIDSSVESLSWHCPLKCEHCLSSVNHSHVARFNLFYCSEARGTRYPHRSFTSGPA